MRSDVYRDDGAEWARTVMLKTAPGMFVAFQLGADVTEEDKADFLAGALDATDAAIGCQGCIDNLRNLFRFAVGFQQPGAPEGYFQLRQHPHVASTGAFTWRGQRVGT